MRHMAKVEEMPRFNLLPSNYSKQPFQLPSIGHAQVPIGHFSTLQDCKQLLLPFLALSVLKTGHAIVSHLSTVREITKLAHVNY